MPHKRSYNGRVKRNNHFTSYLTRRQQFDAIRAEIKDHSRQDPNTGEKAFHPNDRQKINDLLIGGGYLIETTQNIYTKPPDQLAKHVKIHAKREWLTFEKTIINNILDKIEDGQVLNRPP